MLRYPPPSLGSPLKQFDGVAESSILHPQLQERCSPTYPDRGNVMRRHADAAPQPSNDEGVSCPGMPGPGPSRGGSTPTDRQIGNPTAYVVKQREQVGEIETAITVGHGNKFCGCGDVFCTFF